MAKDNSDPAFPQFMGMATNPEGMTLRDYFAGQALAGMLADGERSKLLSSNVDDDEFAIFCAGWSYILADAMIAERNKE